MSEFIEVVGGEEVHLHRLQDFVATLQVRRADDHVGTIAIAEGVHVLDKNASLGKAFQHNGERPRCVGAGKTYHIGDFHGEMSLLEHFVTFLGVTHDASQDAEVGIVGDAQGRQVDAGLAEHLGHLCQTPRFVLEEYGQLFCYHGCFVLGLKDFHDKDNGVSKHAAVDDALGLAR